VHHVQDELEVLLSQGGIHTHPLVPTALGGEHGSLPKEGSPPGPERHDRTLKPTAHWNPFGVWLKHPGFLRH
jgi:hypothetical protein